MRLKYLIRKKEEELGSKTVQKVKYLTLKNISAEKTIKLNNAQDIDKFIESLRKKLKEELEEYKNINLRI